MQTTFDQIGSLSLNKEKPLLIFDADEVLVLFASHFSKYLIKKGWHLNLRGYRLDDAIVHIEDGHIADKVTYQKLIDDFINQETASQPEAPGASETLKKFKDRAEIVILTNVPTSAYNQRIENLSKLNMIYPTISNSGMKGSALVQLTKLTSKTCIFVDDNPYQIASAAKCVPDIYRFHFTACDIVKRTMPYADGATHRPSSWKEISVLLDQLLS
jgi:phosphoglycolate phosphatase-like HAD superfamily hydrolase